MNDGPLTGCVKRFLRGVRRTVRGAMEALLLSVLVACSADGVSTHHVMTRDTVEGGLIRVTHQGPGVWTDSTRWRLEEEFRIGQRGGEGLDQFGAIAWISAREDGVIGIIEAMDQQVRLYDSSGRGIRSIGRKGEGPGEIKDAQGLIFKGDDQAVVWDVGNRRYSTFSSDGEFLGSQRRELSGVVVPWMGQYLTDGRLLDWFPRRGVVESTWDGTRRRVEWYPVLIAPDRSVDTMPPIQYDSDVILGGQMRRKWGNGVKAAVVGNQPEVWFAHTHDYRLIVRTLQGDTTMTISRTVEPVSVTSAEKDSVIAYYAQYGVPVEDADISDTKPIIERIVGGQSEYVLVFVRDVMTGPAGVALDVFQSSGELLGRISWPARTEYRFPAPFFTGEHIYAVAYDDLDVPYVVKMRVVKPG